MVIFVSSKSQTYMKDCPLSSAQGTEMGKKPLHFICLNPDKTKTTIQTLFSSLFLSHTIYESKSTSDISR